MKFFTRFAQYGAFFAVIHAFSLIFKHIAQL